MYKEVTMTDSNADFLAAFGVNSEDQQETTNSSGDDNANPGAQNSDVNSADDSTAQQGQNGQDSQNAQNDQIDNQNDQNDQNAQANNQQDTAVRTNHAFAQMRSENTQMKRLISNIAGVLGIDANTPQDQMQAAVHNAVLNAQAKQRNIDPAVYREIAELKQYKENSERQSFTNRALIGFQTVKNQFNLSDADIDDFANQLMKDGVNPFTSEVNLMAEYKLRNFDSLIAAAEQRGAAQEATRQQTVAAHSTSPNKATGAGADSEPDKINSMSELNKWFDKNNTK